MRDALSILDKIVSFTNGQVTYSNTLEHLNILDEEFYFQMVDCMVNQDLSGLLLLYDNINRKGFEGDLVLNGFAEFMRNLLVSRDETAISLLDVVEGFQEKYLQTTKKLSPSLIVSALNILNEAEINYKAARNKRLHVELALIKLCYLQQAIDLTAGSGKKKQTESSLAFRRAPIAPLKIETKKTEQGGAKLIIDAPQEKVTAKEEPKTTTETKKTKLSALDKIRKQVKGTNGNGNGNGNTYHPLNAEELQVAWDEYAALLKSEKNAAGQNLEMADLKVQDENSFTAFVTNNIQFRFIEQQGQKISQYLREKLHNNQLQFFIVMEENKEPKPITGAPLTAREQYNKLAEEYPLVKELKNRLRLELDY